jgi:hypothetical protein
MSTQAQVLETETVGEVALRVFRNPLRTFVVDWNWKAALLSGLFRAAFFSIAVIRGRGALQTISIELGFRILIGGFWGSLIQAFRAARPAWLAAMCAALVLPGTAHLLEFFALQAGHAHGIRAGMVVSIGISGASLFLNWCLMRKGMLITGAGAGSLGDDFRRLPAALAGLFRGRFS